MEEDAVSVRGFVSRRVAVSRMWEVVAGCLCSGIGGARAMSKGLLGVGVAVLTVLEVVVGGVCSGVKGAEAIAEGLASFEMVLATARRRLRSGVK
jgi:hypothetical protein